MLPLTAKVSSIAQSKPAPTKSCISPSTPGAKIDSSDKPLDIPTAETVTSIPQVITSEKPIESVVSEPSLASIPESVQPKVPLENSEPINSLSSSDSCVARSSSQTVIECMETPVKAAPETLAASGQNSDTPEIAQKAPSPAQQEPTKENSPEGVKFESRSYRTVVEKYSIGVHTVKRNLIQLGSNSRIVTIAGVMKVVNSFRAQGFIRGVNTPVVVFNTPDPKFENIEVVRNSPELILEIVTSGTLMCDAGQHRELALRYLENPVNVLATDAPVPTDQEVEILLNVKDEYDFFVIGKKHNKITQAQNNEHIIDCIRQVGRMWEKVNALGGKRKKVVMSDAYRLNCAEFGAEDMKSTKFTVHFSFFQTFTSNFLKHLEAITREVGADVMPVSAMEVLVKFVKQTDMKGRPILTGQLQLESLNYFERHFKQNNNKQLATKLFETVVLPYLVMILTMQQTAIGLLPDEDGQYQMPEVVSKYFSQHLHNLETGANGLAFAQDFYNTHVAYWQESKGYLPAELKFFFTTVDKPTTMKRTLEAAPIQEGDFASTKKKKQYHLHVEKAHELRNKN